MNVLLMLLDHAEKPNWLSILLLIQRLLFLVIFMLEVILILVAHGPGILVDDSAARFDVIVFAGAAVGFFVDMNITAVFQVFAVHKYSCLPGLG